MHQNLSLTSSVVLTPHRPALRSGDANIVDVLVQIQAPDAPPGHTAQRASQALALVIDRSGSMDGHPLTEAKRCAEYVLGKLRPTDSIGLVTFASQVQRLHPATILGDGAAQRLAVVGIQAGGNTNLHGGWQEGVSSLADVPGHGLKRVMLLSDGQANVGMTNPHEMAAQCAAWAMKGITTSTYGLGRSFNEDLMVAMARAGGGNHYYGDTAEDLMDPFQQELELLGNTCLRDLKLSALVPEGCSVAVANELPKSGNGWRLPDLAWGAEAWAVLRVTVPASVLLPPGRLQGVLQVTVEANSLEGEAVSLERCRLALPVVESKDFERIEVHALVTRRLVELAAAQTLDKMRSAAAIGDWEGVNALLEGASSQFAENEWVASVLQAMRSIAQGRERERAMKEMLYSSRKLKIRLSARDEDETLSIPGEGDGPAYLRRKAAQGKGAV